MTARPDATLGADERPYQELPFPALIKIEGNFYSESQVYAAIDADRAALAAPAVVVSAEPVAWLYTMHTDCGESRTQLSEDRFDFPHHSPFGMPGVDYSETFVVTESALYATPVGPDAVDALDAARYRWLRECPALVRALVLPLGYGYSHVVGADMHGPAYLDETLDEVRESGKDAWGKPIDRESMPFKGAA